MSDDRPRFLHANATKPYTRSAALAARGEPEALSESDQERVTDDVHRERDRLLRHEWSKTSARIVASLAHFEQVTSPVPPDLGRQLRNVRRVTAAVDKRLL